VHGRCPLESSASGYFVQNIVGCVLMGAIARHKKSMSEFLAVGLASGLCGSLTTWATWMGEEAITFMNGYPVQACASLVSMLCVSLCSYRLGFFMAGCGMGDEPLCFDEWCGLRWCIRRKGRGRSRGTTVELEDKPKSESRSSPARDEESSEDSDATVSGSESGGDGAVDTLDWGLRVDASCKELPAPEDVKLSPGFEWSIVALAFFLVLACVVLCGSFDYEAGLFDLAMAPAGALLRWYLSLYNPWAQKSLGGIPVFTLLANTLACACNAASAVLSNREHHEVSKLALAAISTGFAGCLSTVSTLVGELRSDTIGGLRVRVSYFLLSFGLAMAVEVPVLMAHC